MGLFELVISLILFLGLGRVLLFKKNRVLVYSIGEESYKEFTTNYALDGIKPVFYCFYNGEALRLINTENIGVHNSDVFGVTTKEEKYYWRYITLPCQITVLESRVGGYIKPMISKSFRGL